MLIVASLLSLLFLSPQENKNVTLLLFPKVILNQFIPDQTLGFTLDGHQKGDTNRILTPHNINFIRSSGLKSLSYRLRTELGDEAWHWNPIGSWSDPKNSRGYWQSSLSRKIPIKVSYGYRLPRRGNTKDQANNDGYSRIDDGNPNTFWKSDPYLTTSFTGTLDALHPQWVVIDLGHVKKLNEIVINWMNPYAKEFKIQFWNMYGEPNLEEGIWTDFPLASHLHGHFGVQRIRLSNRLTESRWVRVIMTASSSTCPKGSNDPRDFKGYAISEISIGRNVKDKFGRPKFEDEIVHSRNSSGPRKQSTIYVSSTDCWHRASDIDTTTEQPGLDKVLNSGLGSSEPYLFPIPALFGTPEDSSRLVQYLSSSGAKLKGIEIGEEPDGQMVEPADYAERYRQIALEVRKYEPKVPIGGPSMQTTEVDYTAFPRREDRPWFVQQLVARLRENKMFLPNQRANNFQFFSFEWYPFDDVCKNVSENVKRHSQLLTSVFSSLKQRGVPNSIPWYLTEYGFSAFSGEPEVTMDGALLDCDIVGKGLEQGAKATYFYGAEPSTLEDEKGCGSYGDNMLFLGDDEMQAKYRTASYWAEWLLTHKWLNSGEMPVLMIRSQLISSIPEAARDLRAYSVEKKNGMVSVLILNLSKENSERISVPDLKGEIEVNQFSNKEYLWHSDKEEGYPLRSLAPEDLKKSNSRDIPLPANSITVLTGRLK